MQNQVSNFSRGLISSVFVIFVILAFLPVFTAHAQTQPTDTYKVLAPLPGTFNESTGKTDIQRYLPGIFNLAIGVSAAFVLLNLVFGGFLWMSSDAFTKKEEGKKRIENSLKGILLVAGAWIILFTINPSLLDVKLDIESIEVPSSATSTLIRVGGAILTPAQITESNTNRAALQADGIYTYAPHCVQGQRRGCVNLNGLQETTKAGLISLRQSFGSDLVITGGTEEGHSATGGHPTGTAIDFGFSRNPNLDSFVDKNKIGNPVSTSYGPLYTVNVDGKQVKFLKEDDHWHVNF